MEGNQMKMLNALKGIVDICDGKVECKSTSEERLLIYNLAKSALTAPKRNCDVGTAEEQAKRFSFFCMRYHGCSKCDLNKRRKDCKFSWAQMPYVAEEGGTK